MLRLLLLFFLVSLNVFAGPSDFSWLLQKEVRDSGQFAHDKRSSKVLEKIVPEFKLKKNAAPNLAGLIRITLMLPGEKGVVDGRFIIFSGARPHSATEHALVWIDTLNGVGAFALNQCVEELYIKECITAGSKFFGPDKIPDQFRVELKKWLKNEDSHLALQFLKPDLKLQTFEVLN